MRTTAACRLFLPESAETQLLRACLLEGDAVRTAFNRWSQTPESVPSSLRAGGGAKRRLLPLLSASLQRAEVNPSMELRALLTAAQMYEQLRTRAFAEISSDVIEKLNAIGIPYLATRGISFAAGLYREDEFRHCHDVDLLVPGNRVSAAAAVLVDHCGCRITEANELEDLVLHHASGLPIVLHRRALRFPAYEYSGLLWVGLKQRSIVQRGYGRTFKTLSPEDTLLHLVLHAAGGSQSNNSLMWLCDAWKLVASRTLHWEHFLESTQDGLRILPLLYTLQYLRNALDAPVPDAVLADLRAAASRLHTAENRQGQELIVFSLQYAFPGGRKALLQREENWWIRTLLLYCFLFPSAETLRAFGRIARNQDVHGYRLLRLVRGGWDRLRTQLNILYCRYRRHPAIQHAIADHRS